MVERACAIGSPKYANAKASSSDSSSGSSQSHASKKSHAKAASATTVVNKPEDTKPAARPDGNRKQAPKPASKPAPPETNTGTPDSAGTRRSVRLQGRQPANTAATTPKAKPGETSAANVRKRNVTPTSANLPVSTDTKPLTPQRRSSKRQQARANNKGPDFPKGKSD